jgi:hypothetical protein
MKITVFCTLEPLIASDQGQRGHVHAGSVPGGDERGVNGAR